MNLSATDRAFLRGQFPAFERRGLTGMDLDRAIDAWYAHDHYDDNHVYTWSDESVEQ